MIFNFWRPYPFLKPKKEGWYQCTVIHVGYCVVIDLYYQTDKDRWLDNRRQSVFNGYKVYKSGREPLEYNRVETDGLCDRSEKVLAWKKLPRGYRWKKKK